MNERDILEYKIIDEFVPTYDISKFSFCPKCKVRAKFDYAGLEEFSTNPLAVYNCGSCRYQINEFSLYFYNKSLER